MAKMKTRTRRQLLGVLPAAGRATRLGPIPCSKEIMPLSINADSQSPTGLRVSVAIECALEAFRAAGVQQTIVITLPEKNDIGDFLGDGSRWGLDLHYHLVEETASTSATIDCAHHLFREADVALAFPDIQFSPRDAIGKIADARHRIDADLTLALVPSDDGKKVDIVNVDDSGRILSLQIKPGKEHKGWTWVAAAWAPSFTDFFHKTLENMLRCNDNSSEGSWEPTPEIFVGDIVNKAIRSGMKVHGLVFDEGDALDIGTPDSLGIAWSKGRA
ncbi:MAG: nucleotidyltransferase family protein [Gammaproteobacteria bacterium]